MSDKTKTLTSQGAPTSIPSGSAIVTVNEAGKITPIAASVIPDKGTVRSTVTPEPLTGWLRVAVCMDGPFVGIISLCGSYTANHGDGSPFVFALGGGATFNTGYIDGRIKPIVKTSTVSKIRAVTANSKLYIDLQFTRGGGLPAISLSGAYNVELLTPYIPDEPTDESKVYVYTVPA